MKIRLVPIIVLATTLLLFASCLGDDSDEYDFYDDTAVTSFTLGTLNQYLTTKDSNGDDSVYVEQYTGSAYKFYIDNARGQIYNQDSLPYGTDVEHIVATLYTKNGGIALIKNIDNDSLKYFSSSDSIDYSVPRTLRVYSQSGLNLRDYVITVNVHKQIGDTLCWMEMPECDAFGGFDEMKSLACGENIYVFGTDGNTTTVYYMNRDGNTSWMSAVSNMNIVFDADAYRNAIEKDGYVYILNSGTLFRSQDAQAWETVSASTSLKNLVGASSSEMYGISADGSLMVSHDSGVTWTEDQLDEDKALLPCSSFSCISHDLSSNEGVERVMLVGKDTDGSTVRIWTKLVDNSGVNAKQYPWAYVDVAGDDHYALPALDGLTVLDYDDNAVAFGKGSSGLSKFLVSLDGGITWKSDDSYYYPENFTGGTAFAASVDSDNFIWLVENTTGKVWRGRINRLGWKEDDKIFLE